MTTAKQITVMGPNEVDMTADIKAFGAFIGLNAAAPDRVSMLLILALFGGFKSGLLNPAKVVHEIRALEGIGRPSKLKPPIQNKHPPLKGLWHKHYQEDGVHSMARNLKKGLMRYGIPLFERRVAEAQEAGEERYLTAEDIDELTNDAVHGNWQRLASAEEITGEWIMFAKHEGKNYYLCLATHDKATHPSVRQQIDALCCAEFPFLDKLLADAEAGES